MLFFPQYKVLRSHRRQYIRELKDVALPGIFRGRPEIAAGLAPGKGREIESVCPSGAFSGNPVRIDLGKCVFCGECARMSPDKIRFTNDYRMGSNVRENLIVREGMAEKIGFDANAVREEIFRLFARALKLREVSAGGDNSCEMELNASMNVNFDFSRYGIEFVASPRHADGIVITGPVTKNMSKALRITYDAMPCPKLIIAAGCDAVSGGVFAGSPALDRSFFERHTPDLWLPGNPVHPMTFIDGVLTLLKHWRR